MATDMTAEQAEKYVRERWLVFKESIYEPHEGYSIPQTRIDIGSAKFTKVKRDDALIAAAEYTRAREQKIAEKREEIDFLDFAFSVQDRDEDSEIVERILAREQAALDELLRGWRQK